MMKVLAAVQALTCISLALLWARAGSYRLATAQACYAVATTALFLR